MPRNGQHSPRRPRIEMGHSSATPDEAAAIAAAIEQFLRDTAPPPPPPAALGGWARSAVLGAAGAGLEAPSPWGDSEPWGR